MRMRTVSIAFGILLAGWTMAFAQAPVKCPEGRAMNGACVDPSLAQDLRTSTLVLSQPKLSMTNPPVMPYQDGQYDIPRDHHEISNLHGYPSVTSATGNTITFPDSFGRPRTVNTGPRP